MGIVQEPSQRRAHFAAASPATRAEMKDEDCPSAAADRSGLDLEGATNADRPAPLCAAAPLGVGSAPSPASAAAAAAAASSAALWLAGTSWEGSDSCPDCCSRICDERLRRRPCQFKSAGSIGGAICGRRGPASSSSLLQIIRCDDLVNKML